ncbi:MAG: prolipoprotein diacylglyceryl transferase [Gammaproteobacteria bacterium]|nr:prolipoprotein diacylglyceryl transferase [Gemmatimonadota bacterium]NIU77948.1 prolipoprotein diacylglyceryl transferase [Gammaproteobacteria bacterium]NIT67905.1 prolipoprotein diacylglyceryl transferase [Gemmatimonadota bacterium]NIV24570.1 prolipoprotein diacylglyceryl transferase [Gemmatimonadota bacterium]NIY11400.1 prolipoprotein diacylglyceryl transferase [Gemmatimonadota bacterium]
MHNVLFRFGHLTITTYGVILAIAVLAAGQLFARGMKRTGRSTDDAWSVVTWALVGGIIGAKLYYVILNQDPGALFSRSGFVWYGGLIGGAIAVVWPIRRRGLLALRTLDALAPAAALGHAIGHVGCFFSGDSYGLPSDLPWAVAFPNGMPPSTAGNLRAQFGVDIPAGIPDSALLTVHPTMLYSTIILSILAFGLWWGLKRQGPAGLVFGAYLVLAGIERFFIEFLRAKDDRFLAGFTTAQAIAVILILIGATLVATRLQRRARSSPATSRGAGHASRPRTAL